MDKEKYILRVQPIATIGTWLILLAIFILFIFMPSWGNFEKSELDSKIIFYSILVIICLLCFISFIYQLQYAKMISACISQLSGTKDECYFGPINKL